MNGMQASMQTPLNQFKKEIVEEVFFNLLLYSNEF